MVGELGLVGFYVTRFVEAVDVKAAEAVALQVLRSEPKLAAPRGFTPTRQTRVIFEEIAEVDAEKVPATELGFAWYPMSQDNA
jgi:hypothetical protein